MDSLASRPPGPASSAPLLPPRPRPAQHGLALTRTDRLSFRRSTGRPAEATPAHPMSRANRWPVAQAERGQGRAEGSARPLCLDRQPPHPPRSGLGGRLGPACPGPQAGVRALAPCLHSRVCPRREGGTGAVLGLPEQHRSPGGWARRPPPRGALCPGRFCPYLSPVRMAGSGRGGPAQDQQGPAGRAASRGRCPSGL